jgi:hypothetical protein
LLLPSRENTLAYPQDQGGGTQHLGQSHHQSVGVVARNPQGLGDPAGHLPP